VGEGPKILLTYNIIRRIDHYSLAVSLRDENKVNTIDPEDELYGCNMKGKIKAGVFLVQHKTTSGQYIAHNFLFTDYNDAFRYRNTKWRKTSEIQQKNLVRVANIYLQMLDNFQFQATIIKASTQPLFIMNCEYGSLLNFSCRKSITVTLWISLQAGNR
jgi:hypothetical protein